MLIEEEDKKEITKAGNKLNNNILWKEVYCQYQIQTYKVDLSCNKCEHIFQEVE